MSTLTTPSIAAVAAVLVLPGCGSEPSGDPVADDGVSDAGEPTADSDDGADDAPVATDDDGGADDAPTDGDDDGATDDGATDDGATDDGGDPPLDVCDPRAGDPEADATIVVDWSEWPEADPGSLGDFETAVEIDASCTVSAVDPSSDPVVTELLCDDAGTMRALSISIPAADAPVAWAAEDAVTVAFSHMDYGRFYGLWRDDITMRRAADDGLLLAAMNQENLFEATFAPLTVEVDETTCQPEGGGSIDDTWNLVVLFGTEDGATTSVADEQRGGIAPADGDGWLAIDVDEARIGADYCCHASRELEVLVRRTESM